MEQLLLRKEIHKLFQEFGTQFPNLNLQHIEQELSKIIIENEEYQSIDRPEQKYKNYYVANGEMKIREISYSTAKVCHDYIMAKGMEESKVNKYNLQFRKDTYLKLKKILDKGIENELLKYITNIQGLLIRFLGQIVYEQISLNSQDEFQLKQISAIYSLGKMIKENIRNSYDKEVLQKHIKDNLLRPILTSLLLKEGIHMTKDYMASLGIYFVEGLAYLTKVFNLNAELFNVKEYNELLLIFILIEYEELIKRELWKIPSSGDVEKREEKIREHPFYTLLNQFQNEIDAEIKKHELIAGTIQTDKELLLDAQHKKIKELTKALSNKLQKRYEAYLLLLSEPFITKLIELDILLVKPVIKAPCVKVNDEYKELLMDFSQKYPYIYEVNNLQQFERLEKKSNHITKYVAYTHVKETRYISVESIADEFRNNLMLGGYELNVLLLKEFLTTLLEIYEIIKTEPYPSKIGDKSIGLWDKNIVYVSKISAKLSETQLLFLSDILGFNFVEGYQKNLPGHHAFYDYILKEFLSLDNFNKINFFSHSPVGLTMEQQLIWNSFPFYRSEQPAKDLREIIWAKKYLIRDFLKVTNFLPYFEKFGFLQTMDARGRVNFSTGLFNPEIKFVRSFIVLPGTQIKDLVWDNDNNTIQWGSNPLDYFLQSFDDNCTSNFDLISYFNQRKELTPPTLKEVIALKYIKFEMLFSTYSYFIDIYHLLRYSKGEYAMGEETLTTSFNLDASGSGMQINAMITKMRKIAECCNLVKADETTSMPSISRQNKLTKEALREQVYQHNSLNEMYSKFYKEILIPKLEEERKDDTVTQYHYNSGIDLYTKFGDEMHSVIKLVIDIFELIMDPLPDTTRPWDLTGFIHIIQKFAKNPMKVFSKETFNVPAEYQLSEKTEINYILNQIHSIMKGYYERAVAPGPRTAENEVFMIIYEHINDICNRTLHYTIKDCRDIQPKAATAIYTKLEELTEDVLYYFFMIVKQSDHI